MKLFETIWAETCPDFTDLQKSKLSRYRVPLLATGGSCSLTKKLEDEPFQLRSVLGDLNCEDYDYLWRLNQLVDYFETEYGIDWIGIYKRIEVADTQGAEKDPFLLKLAYRGRESRAKFPLTEAFAVESNNSTVGLSGEEILVQNIGDYDGPYYVCDSEVNSEFCAPIVDSNGHVIGIIDAESFQKDFFDEVKLNALRKLCEFLGDVL